MQLLRLAKVMTMGVVASLCFSSTGVVASLGSSSAGVVASLGAGSTGVVASLGSSSAGVVASLGSSSDASPIRVPELPRNIAGRNATSFVPHLMRRHSNAEAFINGDPLGLSIEGVAPGDTISIRAYRRFLQSRQINGATVTDTVLFASWAQFRADKRGHVSVDSARPVNGSWREPDPLGLFWSMQSVSTSGASNSTTIPERTLARGITLIVLVSHGVVIDSLAVRNTLPKLVERVVVTDSTVGAFAAPDDGQRYPALIVLHGSEGGDTTNAKALARRFAARGFATLAVMYVVYPYAGNFSAAPTALANIPIETLDRARGWLGAQRQADTSRTGIWGVSKGAEFALVAASRRAWPRAVVACVASDVVWSGFGRVPAAGEMLSSWSDHGIPLASIPYDRYDDVFANKATAREVHDRSRTKFVAEARSAHIDVNAIRAPTLVFGSDSDEVWASAAMVRRVRQAMRKAGNGKLLVARTFERAGHGICGDGTTPASLFTNVSSNKDAAGAVATARASSATWRETVQFLQQKLK